jgi:hypothetical protein
MLPHLGVNILISLPRSCVACGSVRPMADMGDSGTNGVISCEINKILFAFIVYFATNIFRGLQKYKKKDKLAN